MTTERIFLAAVDDSLSRAEFVDGGWQVAEILSGMQINCIVSDPTERQKVYLGTQRNGIWFSSDSGKNWSSLGLEENPVKSLAISPHDPNIIYAGCKPVSLYVSKDGGQSWKEYAGLRRARLWWWFSPAEPPDWNPYVMSLTISPTDPSVLLAGIELGGVLRSDDGGKTWSRHRRGALLDSHDLTFHPADGDWAYQAGAGLRSGASFSRDGGLTWRKPKAIQKKTYGWQIAADSQQPEVFYLASSGQPNLLRGEFEPPAHVEGHARAGIFRSIGGAPLEEITHGLPDPLNMMPYALVPDSQEKGNLYTALINGEVWQTKNFGDLWARMPFKFDGRLRRMILV